MSPICQDILSKPGQDLAAIHLDGPEKSWQFFLIDAGKIGSFGSASKCLSAESLRPGCGLHIRDPLFREHSFRVIVGYPD
jgi:hypothetical protein